METLSKSTVGLILILKQPNSESCSCCVYDITSVRQSYIGMPTCPEVLLQICFSLDENSKLLGKVHARNEQPSNASGKGMEPSPFGSKKEPLSTTCIGYQLFCQGCSHNTLAKTPHSFCGTCNSTHFRCTVTTSEHAGF